MKKLLLLSLLVLGANSFGAVIGSEVGAGKSTTVSLPIRTTANVVAATGKQVIIKATTSGMRGDMMEFNFGDIKADSVYNHNLDGQFEVSIGDGTAFTGEGDSVLGSALEIQVSLNNSDFTSAGKTVTSNSSNGLADNMTMTYTLSGALNDAKTKYQGNVNVALNIASPGAAAKTYVDTSKYIFAKVSRGADLN